MDAFAVNSSLSKQALDSERTGLKEVLLGPAQLYEALGEKNAALAHQKQTAKH